MKNISKFALAAAFVGLGVSSQTQARFEKPNIFSAKQTALAGATLSTIQNAESLYYNPAGLAGAQGVGLIADLGIVGSQTSVPVISDNATLDSNRLYAPPMAYFASYGVTDKLGIGVGFYGAGGQSSLFEDNTVAGFTLKPDQESKINFAEASIGAGYEILPGLRIGAAYRLFWVQNATIKGFGNQGVLVATEFNDMTDIKHGYRLGAQYRSSTNRWGVGLVFRSHVSFTAEGTASGKVDTGGGIQDLTGGAVSYSAVFPWKLALSGDYEIFEKNRVFLGWDFTHYAVNREAALAGTLNLPAGLGGTSVLSNIKYHWTNMNTLRFGYENQSLIESMPLRAGYAIQLGVTNPQPEHSIYAGSGIGITESIDLDLALEYSFAKSTKPDTSTSSSGNQGEYASNLFAAHLTTSFRF